MTQLHESSLKVIEQARAQRNIPGRRRIVFVSGYFNVLHPGHLRLLRFAKDCGDFLIVGVFPGDNSKKRPLLDEKFRLDGVLSTSWVDLAFVLHDAPADLIRELKPRSVVKGSEYEGQFNPELEAVQSYGGSLLFSSGDHGFSSIDLLKNEFKRLQFSEIEKPTEYLARHELKLAELVATLGKMKDVNVLVIGDTVLDEYVTCEPLGMSQEDPTIVVSPLFSEVFLGAAGIVAGHAASLGGKVDFFSVVGKDNDAALALSMLEKYRIRAHLYEDQSRISTRKQRYRANGKTLLRVNHLRQHDISTTLQQKIFLEIEPMIDEKHLVIFSDFNYGCLPQALVDRIIECCLKRNIRMVADSQSSSQLGNVSRFHDMDLITPTEREARISSQNLRSGIVVMARELQARSRAKDIFITLGKEGLLVHANTSGSNKWLTDQLPAMNKAPVDTAGAGDSLLVGAALAGAAGATIWQSAYLGSLAAACQVGRLGNVPLTTDELLSELQQ